MTRHKYTWRPDKHDGRDHLFHADLEADATALPASVDLRAQMPPVYDQGQLGSCVDNAVAAAVEFNMPAPRWTPSRLFGYYNARLLEGDTSQDGGSTIRDGIKAVAQYGTLPEADYPYDITRFAQKPPTTAYAEAARDLVTEYQAVHKARTAIKTALAAGHPVIFGIQVFESFESAAVAKSGDVPMPAKGEQLLGGHGVLAVGYDSSHVLVRNSWGAGWGQGGYFTLPWEYLTHYASSFWIIL